MVRDTNAIDRTRKQIEALQELRHINKYAEMFDSSEIEIVMDNKLAKWEQKFSGYILDHAGTRLYRDEMTHDVLIDALSWLDRENYRNTDGKGIEVIAGTALLHELRNDLSDYLRMANESEVGLDGIQIDGAVCRVSPALPDTAAVVVHEDAITPNWHMADMRPWIIRDPAGVVSIELHE